LDDDKEGIHKKTKTKEGDVNIERALFKNIS